MLNDVPGIYVQRSRRVFRENRKTYEARRGCLSRVLKDECTFPYRTGVQDGGRVRQEVKTASSGWSAEDEEGGGSRE